MGVEHRAFAPALALPLLVLLLGACGGSGGAPPNATVPPVSTPPLTEFPIVQLVLAGDGAGLADLAVPVLWPCEPDRAPRCRPGEQPGDLVEVFPTGGCEPSWGFFELVPGAFERMFSAPPTRLYAAYRATGPDDWESDNYVFEARDGSALVVQVIEQGISIVHFACGSTPEGIVRGLVELGLDDWIVPAPD